jgi:4-hydroxy-3-methylbut-2-enyl diphosphate reductase
MTKPSLDILLCAPRGFCAGVVRAIDAVEKALAIHGAPVYVRHEIVHNKYVVENLKRKGAVFVRELDEVPDTQAPVIFSAHGVPKSVPEAAQVRNLFGIDATCPLVTKVHREAQVHHKRGRHIILIGHAGHPEVIGTMGQLPQGRPPWSRPWTISPGCSLQTRTISPSSPRRRSPSTIPRTWWRP